MVTLTNQEDLQKIPISFKPLGQLVPDNIDGHLNIQVPISAIGQLIEKIREDHPFCPCRKTYCPFLGTSGQVFGGKMSSDVVWTLLGKALTRYFDTSWADFG